MAKAAELRSPARGWRLWIPLILGMAALAARAPGMGAILIVGLVGLIGILAPVPSGGPKASISLLAGVTGLGMGAVYLVAWLGQPPGTSPDLLGVGAALAAAVSEEAFFRRFLYGSLAEGGAVLAIAGSATAFAAVHIPAYGWASFPVNLAAGLLFGWQRRISGSWAAPAATHAFANLIGMGVLP
jgi:membrane protease YdiL (CAAX protease family)